MAGCRRIFKNARAAKNQDQMLGTAAGDGEESATGPQ